MYWWRLASKVGSCWTTGNSWCFSCKALWKGEGRPQSKAIRWEKFLLFAERSAFCSVGTITWLQEPTHIMKGILLFTVYKLNVNLIWQYPHRNTQNNVQFNIWAPPGTLKWTYKINHHRRQAENNKSKLLTYWFYLRSSWRWFSCRGHSFTYSVAMASLLLCFFKLCFKLSEA